jgi:thiol-disulfide isomerase/thioredoxin
MNRFMRRIAPLLLALLLVSHPVLAAQSRVGDAFMLLSREPQGWRVDSVGGGAIGKFLKAGDLLTRINGQAAADTGPLAMRLLFGAAYDRSIPIVVRRGGQTRALGLWLSDGAAPPAKPDPALIRKVSLSDAAPDFALPALDGRVARLSGLKGKFVLVSFWATWCAPCMLEEPILNRLANAYSGRLMVLALALKETKASLEAFETKYAPSYSIVDAGSLKAPTAFAYGVTRPGASTVPVNVLVRPDGTVAYVHSGYQAPSPLEVRLRTALDAH